MKKSNSFFTRVFPTFLMVVFAAAYLQLKAQDPSFSQFYNNPIYYNPGYIGLNAGLRTRFNYRDQWTRHDGQLRVGHCLSIEPKCSDGGP